MSDPRHFLDLDKLEAGALRDILARGNELKSAWTTGDRPKPFDGKTLVMIFEKPSTRTRMSFDIAAKQLGGSSIILNPDGIHYGKGDETLKDTAKVLSQYADMIMITAEEMARESAGICRKIFASMATITTIRPVKRKPRIKLKSLRVVKA